VSEEIGVQVSMGTIADGTDSIGSNDSVGGDTVVPTTSELTITNRDNTTDLSCRN